MSHVPRRPIHVVGAFTLIHPKVCSTPHPDLQRDKSPPEAATPRAHPPTQDRPTGDQSMW